jgi:alanine dehydrogenase
MRIAIPRERKDLEKRVALTPEGTKVLIEGGATVFIETGAGVGSGFSDSDYQSAGASITQTLEETWKQAELLVKVKEPAPEETSFFREDLTAFCFLHLASLPELAHELLRSKMTVIAYELVQDNTGRFPLLEPMSEIAGKLAIVNGSQLLLSQTGGSGVLLGGACGSEGAQVTVLGAGVAGTAAYQLALDMGARVTVIDVNHRKIESLRQRGNPHLSALLSSAEVIAASVKESDLLIGAALIPGAKPPRLVTREMVRSMRAGSAIIDISIDQGGCIETIRPTSLSAPTYVEEGIIHYGVCNMPAQAPRTATIALTNRTLPYIIEFAKGAPSTALTEAINVKGGVCTNKASAEALKL